MRLYDELVPWYLLLDPVADHEDEAAALAEGFADAGVATGDLLELGAGAGNNASYLTSRYRCTLVDRSPQMSALSAARNPGSTHVLGDMRDVRLNRTFDAVLIHDAICYLLDEEALRDAMTTAFVHLRPGGVAIFAPDTVAEVFAESSTVEGADDGPRSLRCLAWMWDPDPSDTTYVVDYALLLREGDTVRAEHDRHVEGVFPEATWTRLLAEVGFRARRVDRDLNGAEGYAPFVFVGVRP